MHKKQVLLLAMLLLSAQGALVARTSPGEYEKETRHNIVARQNNNDNNENNNNDNNGNGNGNNNNNNNDNGNDKNDKSQESTTTQPTTAPKSSQQPSSTDATTTPTSSAETSSKKTTSNTPSSTQATSTTSTTSPPTSSTSSTSTSSSSSSSDSDLPSLTPSSSVPTPVVTIPSNDNNPFLIRSNLPEGTVFIAVGAIFGGLALAVMAWRMFASMTLRRSLKRYGNATGAGPQMSAVAPGQDQKRMFYPGDPSRAGDPINNHSTEEFQRRGPSLFFSPTAEVMNSATNAHNQGSMSSTFGNNARSSVYLPAGYYTPGGANAGATGSMTSRTTRHMSMGGGGARESMYGGLAPSVRTSTFNGPRNGEVQHHQPQQRAPSAYLDDLLGHDND